MSLAGQKSDNVRTIWNRLPSSWRPGFLSELFKKPANEQSRTPEADDGPGPAVDPGANADLSDSARGNRTPENSTSGDRPSDDGPYRDHDPGDRGETGDPPDAARPGLLASIRHRLAAILAGIRRLLDILIFSSLTRRIVFLNLAALTTLVVGILYLNQSRASLIDARVQSLRVQGEIIAAAIAASATVDSNVISVNPDRLLESQTGDAFSPLTFIDPSLEFPINPEQVAPLLRNLVTPTRTRARIYDNDGLLILDSQNIYVQGELFPGPSAEDSGPGWLAKAWNAALTWVPGAQFSLYQDFGPDEGQRYPEVRVAMAGAPADIVRVDDQGRLVVSVAVPVKRVRTIVGALLMSTSPGQIDAIVAAERMAILRIAAVAAAVTIVLSLLLARTIAGPVKRLSAAAERVPTSVQKRTEIPDFTDRSDEIGHLSFALRSMTTALFNRIEAIERFAADVAHELKNPLTSLRSAVETLPLTQKPEDREHLHAIIQHDVRRLDRLISDISNASRLDAELARESEDRVDLVALVEAMISVQADVAAKRNIGVILEKRTGRFDAETLGHDSRLAQVFNNLIDNAVSFSPDNAKVIIVIATSQTGVTISVIDEGPGLKGGTEKIFERFYTDRPESESFGDHSGLGLSISRQIIEAHSGTIRAANRSDRSGAVFTTTLPRAARKRAET